MLVLNRSRRISEYAKMMWLKNAIRKAEIVCCALQKLQLGGWRGKTSVGPGREDRRGEGRATVGGTMFGTRFGRVIRTEAGECLSGCC